MPESRQITLALELYPHEDDFKMGPLKDAGQFRAELTPEINALRPILPARHFDGTLTAVFIMSWH